MDLSDRPSDNYALDNRAPTQRPDHGFVEMIDGVVRVHTPTGEDVVHRRWHPNGVLESECSVVNYKPAGVFREWHDNGVLAKETPYQNGVEHGIVRQFNREGKLLGQYEMKQGRGMTFKWHDNGALEMTLHWVSDSAIWVALFDGKPHKSYLWNGKPISRKKWYERLNEAQKADAEAAEAILKTLR